MASTDPYRRWTSSSLWTSPRGAFDHMVCSTFSAHVHDPPDDGDGFICVVSLFLAFFVCVMIMLALPFYLVLEVMLNHWRSHVSTWLFKTMNVRSRRPLMALPPSPQATPPDDLICCKRIYNFRCSMLVLHQLLYVLCALYIILWYLLD